MNCLLVIFSLLLLLAACAPQQQAMPAVQPDEVLEPQVPEMMPVPGEDAAETEVVQDSEAAPERHAGPAKVVDVRIKGFKFIPATVTINAGDTVRWVNEDSAPHDAAGDGWSTKTPMRKDDADEVRFDTAGSYDYICSIHPYMKGTVIVE